MAENLEQRREELAAKLSALTGKSVEEGRREVDLSVQRLFHWGAYCDKYGGSVQVRDRYSSIECDSIFSKFTICKLYVLL